MSRRWRLSSKLVFGLVLVLGSLGLLLATSLRGLTSYSHSMEMFQGKLAELERLHELYPAVDALLSKEPAARDQFRDPDLDRDAVQVQVTAAQEKFLAVRDAFRDRGESSSNTRLAESFAAQLAEFRRRVADFYSNPLPDPEHPERVPSLLTDKAALELHAKLRGTVNAMRLQCHADMVGRMAEAEALYRNCLWVIVAASIATALLTVALVLLCLRWLVVPVRELGAGVRRVTDGNFKEPIVLHSGDELEDLANAFNAMTHRLDNTYQYLEKQVQDRSRQLVRSERLVSVGFLAAGVSHEINNPLASIAFCAEALQSRLAGYAAANPGEGEVVTKYLKMVQNEAFRCKEITSRLLEFSRVGDRKREPADLADLIQNVLEIAQHLQNCRGKRIVFQPYARVVAQVNAQDVKSVVLNLVVNALDSMEEGGTIDISLRADGDFAEMAVADTGCGMRPEVLENIFEPFFTRSKSGKGTGLGLFISHQIVETHGGEIVASSDGVNRGSTFRVRLPLKAVQAAEPSDEGSRDADLYMMGTKRNDGTTWMEDGLGHAA